MSLGLVGTLVPLLRPVLGNDYNWNDLSSDITTSRISIIENLEKSLDS